MKKIQHIDPFFFTHPMNGTLGILLLLILIPITNIFIALIITYLISIIGLLLLNSFSEIRVQIDSIMIGTVTIVSFSVFSVIIDLLYHFHYIGYQLLLLVIYIPVAIVSLIFLRNRGTGLSSMDELCPAVLQRQLLINEIKRINRKFILLSFITIVIVLPLLFRGYVDESCKMSCHTENVVGILMTIPFVLLYVFEIFQLKFLKQKLKNEIWLSLVDDNNNEIGRISKDLICNYKGPSNLSLVRVLVFYKECVFLKCTKENKYETPFVSWLEQGKSIEMQIKDMFQGLIKKDNCNLQKIFTYKTQFKSSVNTLISLYCLRIKDWDDLNDNSGKWWNMQDLFDDMNASALCDMLREELTYINELNTI